MNGFGAIRGVAGGRPACRQTAALEEFSRYLRTFDYAEREAMKIKTTELLDLVRLGKVQVIDIRFPEEVATRRVSFAKRDFQERTGGNREEGGE